MRGDREGESEALRHHGIGTMTAPTELKDDPEGLKRIVCQQGARIVAVDGCPDAGKTILARGIAKSLNGSVVDLDSYLN